MADYTWTIGTDRSDGGIVVNGEDSGSTPGYTRGERTDLEFVFWYDQDIDGSDTDGHVRRYEDLREYGDFAGSMSVERAATGQPHYAERLPNDAPVDSLVLDFRPGADVDATPGFWGIVKAVQDDSRFTADVARLTLQVVVLAELGEFASRSDVQAALGEGVV